MSALERDAAGLRAALDVITRLETTSSEPALLNMTAAAKLVTAAALARQESRGGHWRSDFPQTAKTGTRTFMTLADADAHRRGRRGRSRQPRPQMTLSLDFTRPPPALLVEPQVRAALEEDLGRAGDITSELTIPADKQATAQVGRPQAGPHRRPDLRRSRLPAGRSVGEIRPWRCPTARMPQPARCWPPSPARPAAS